MTHKKNWFRIISFATAITFTATSVYGQPLVTVAGPASLVSPEVRIPDKFDFPQDLGTLQEFSHSDASDRFVIYIQDAHAIVDAQKNMQALIEYFQQQFNIRFVAVEGTQSDLDPLIFQTFPDEFIKKKVLAEYAAKGELSGSELAAIFSPMPASYVGLEEWGLYEENHRAFLQADVVEGKLLDAFQAMRDTLDAKRQAAYSPEFNEFHEKVTSFRDEKSDLFKLLKYLQTLDPKGERITEARFPHLLPVFQASAAEDRFQNENLEVMLKQMADKLKEKMEGKLPPSDLREFNEKYQTFVTGQIDAGSFLKYLVDTGRKIKMNPKLTPKLRELLGQTETLGMIKGSKLFEELETLLNEYESEFSQTPEQKEISVRYHRLRVLSDLSRLEWTREQLDEFRADEAGYRGLAGDLMKDIEPAIEFYRLAMQRDSVFLERIEKVMDREKTKGVIVLTGGFHAEGFEQRLRERHYSYAVVMPKMNSLEGHENYAPVMKGELSYKRFLKTTLYDAFVKDATLKMVSEMNESDFRRNIKVWRDEIIRRLSEQGRIEKSGEYTRYVDQLFRYYADRFGFNQAAKSDEEIMKGVNDEVEQLNKETLSDLVEQFQQKSRAFMDGFKELAGTGKLSVPEIKSLYARISSGQPSAVAMTPSLSRDGTPALFALPRSEARATASSTIVDEVRIEDANTALRAFVAYAIGFEKLLTSYLESEAGKKGEDRPLIEAQLTAVSSVLDTYLGKGQRDADAAKRNFPTLQSLDSSGRLTQVLARLDMIEGFVKRLADMVSGANIKSTSLGQDFLDMHRQFRNFNIRVRSGASALTRDKRFELSDEADVTEPLVAPPPPEVVETPAGLGDTAPEDLRPTPRKPAMPSKPPKPRSVLPPPPKPAPPPAARPAPKKSVSGKTSEGTPVQQRLAEMARSWDVDFESLISDITEVYDSLLALSPEFEKITLKVKTDGFERKVSLEDYLDSVRKIDYFEREKRLTTILKALQKKVQSVDQNLEKARKALGDKDKKRVTLLYRDSIGRKLVNAPSPSGRVLLERYQELYKSPLGPGAPAPTPPGIPVEGMVYTPEELESADGRGYGKPGLSANQYGNLNFPGITPGISYSVGAREDGRIVSDVRALIAAYQAVVNKMLDNDKAIAEAKEKKVAPKVKPITYLDRYNALLKSGRITLNDLIGAIDAQYQLLLGDVQEVYTEYGQDGEGLDVDVARATLQIDRDRLARARFAAEALREFLNRAAIMLKKSEIPETHQPALERLTQLIIWMNYLDKVIQNNMEKVDADDKRFSRDNRDSKEFGGVWGRELAAVGMFALEEDVEPAAERELVNKTDDNLRDLNVKTMLPGAKFAALFFFTASVVYLATAVFLGLALIVPIVLVVATLTLSLPLMFLLFEFRKGNSQYSFWDAFFSHFWFRPVIRLSALKVTLDMTASQRGKLSSAERRLQAVADSEIKFRRLGRAILRSSKQYMDEMEGPATVFSEYSLAFAPAGLFASVLLTMMGFKIAALLGILAFVVLIVAGVVVFSIRARKTGVDLIDWLDYRIRGFIRPDVLSAATETVADRSLEELEGASKEALQKIIAIEVNGEIFYPRRNKAGLAVIKSVREILKSAQRVIAKGVSDESVRVIQLTERAAASARSELRVDGEEAAGVFRVVSPLYVSLVEEFRALVPELTALEAGRQSGSYANLPVQRINEISTSFLRQIAQLEFLRTQGSPTDAQLATVRAAFDRFFDGLQQVLLTSPENIARQSTGVLAAYNIAVRTVLSARSADATQSRAVLANLPTDTVVFALNLLDQIATLRYTLEDELPANSSIAGAFEKAAGYSAAIRQAYPAFARSEARQSVADSVVAPVISDLTSVATAPVSVEAVAGLTAPQAVINTVAVTQLSGIEALAPINDVASRILEQFSGDADLNEISQVFSTLSAERRDAVVKPAQEQLRTGISSYLNAASQKGQNLTAVILSQDFDQEITRLTDQFAESVFTDENVRKGYSAGLQERFSARLQRYVVNSVILGYELQQAQAARTISVDGEAVTQFTSLTQGELETRYQALLVAAQGNLEIDGVKLPSTLFSETTPESKTSYVLDASFMEADFMKVLLGAEHPVAMAYSVGTPGEKSVRDFAKELGGLMRMIFSTLGARNDQPVDLNRLSKVNFSPESRKSLIGTRLAVKNGGLQGDTVVQTQENFVNVVGEKQFLPLMVRFLATNLVNQLPETRQDGSRIVVLDEKHLSIFLNLVKRLTTEYRSEIRAAQSA